MALHRSEVPDLDRTVRLSVCSGQLYVRLSSILLTFDLCLQIRNTVSKAAYLVGGIPDRKWITTVKNTHVSSEAHVPISLVLNRRPSTRTGTKKASDRAATPGYISGISPADLDTLSPSWNRSQGEYQRPKNAPMPNSLAMSM